MASGWTIERAHGRWREVLTHLAIGIPPKYLTNKQGPCPVCGGKDRFRFDDRGGSGSFYCNQCGAGYGIHLVQRFLGCTFKEAANAVDQAIGELSLTSRPTPKRTANSGHDRDQRQREFERTLDRAKDGKIVTDHLASRGLSIVPAAMHGHPALPFFDDGQLIGHFPAVVSPVYGPDGDLRSVHRIWLSDQIPREERKALMPAAAPVKGGAIRLFDAGETVGIAEGPETAIAAYERDGVPTWSATSSTIMEAFEPPAGVRCVVVYGDNDLNFEGQRAAYSLARRLVGEGYGVDVRIPSRPGADWLDVHAQPGAGHD